MASLKSYSSASQISILRCNKPRKSTKMAKSGRKTIERPSTGSFPHFIELYDLTCVDASGGEFERYGTLYLATDIFRDGRVNPDIRTHYDHVVSCEQKRWFLPSFALSCAILEALYANRTDPTFNHVLQQYKDWGHAQNTIINYTTEEVIHYPRAADFNQVGTVNAPRFTIQRGFVKTGLEDNLLKDALRDAAYERLVRQLTGRPDPSVLIELGEYFDKPARLTFPWFSGSDPTDEVLPTSLGAQGDHFDLCCGDLLGIGIELRARGVREP